MPFTNAALPIRGGVTPQADLNSILESALLGLPRRLAVVFFHVDQEPGHPFELLQAGHRHDYHAVIAKSVSAARAVYPEALIVMLTDQATQFDAGLPVELIRLPLVREWIMYERCRAQLAFASVWAAHAIHIDTDVVLQKPFHDLFALGFDVALAYRPDQPGMHINGGMLLCGKAPGFTKFMVDLVRMYDAVADAADWNGWDLRCFRGGQIALAALMYGRVPGVHEMAWGRVAVFNAREINRTYGEPGVTQPYAFHYKGHRKQRWGVWREVPQGPRP